MYLVDLSDATRKQSPAGRDEVLTRPAEWNQTLKRLPSLISA